MWSMSPKLEMCLKNMIKNYREQQIDENAPSRFSLTDL